MEENMGDRAETELENDCEKLFSAFRGLLSWKWDSRLEAVLAEFGVSQKGDIRAILERILPMTWNSSNIGKAPDMVRTVNGHLGELRPGQQLFTSDPEGDDFVFCAWWPWGDGKTISIRIAPFYKNLSDSEKPEKIQLLKGWFGI